MPDTHIIPARRRAQLWIAMGRQRVGKTVALNLTVQYFTTLGSSIVVLNGDQQNRTHSLSTFFPGARVPPATGISDNRSWIEAELFEMIRCGYHAVLDAGGGWTGLSSLLDDVPLAEALAENGVDVTALFMLGTEQADVDYLEKCSQGGAFVPSRTALVLNEGLILSDRSSAGAFAPVMANAVVTGVIGQGAKVVMMPGLSCMSAVTDRGISFVDAAAGKVRPGQTPMGLFDPMRVREFWNKKVPAFFDQFPEEWLPLDPPTAEPMMKRSKGDVA